MKRNKVLLCLLPLAFSSIGVLSCEQSNIINNEKKVVFYNRLGAGFRLPLKEFSVLPQVPYIRVEEFFKTFMKESKQITYATYLKDNVYTFTNTRNNSTAKIDFSDVKNATIKFSDYDSFTDNGDGYTPVGDLFTDAGKKVFTCVESEYNKDKVDLTKVINLKNYDIELVVEKNQYYYAPVATMIDIFMPEYPYVYNGEAFYYNENFYSYDAKGAYTLTDYGKSVKEKNTLKYDESYKKYVYNELCLVLDFSYGLRFEKSIGSFKTYFQEKGVETSILNGNYNDLDEQLNQIFNNYLDDHGHTYISSTGSTIFEKNLINNIFVSKHNEESYVTYNEYVTARNNYYKLLKEPIAPKEYYDESTKTLMLNLDSFSFFPINPTTGEFNLQDKDSMAYVIYNVNQRIHTTPQYCDNIIINLTLNGGGSDYAELYLESWVNGYATQYLTSSFTGAKSYIKYAVDVNFDGKIDDSDTISKKVTYKDGETTYEKTFNVMVVTSRYSYSNANVFAGMVKQNRNVRDGKTVFVGNKTDGGCCCTVTKNTVAGNTFNISSSSQATYSDRSSFESGVDVDNGKTISYTTEAEKQNYFSINSLLPYFN